MEIKYIIENGADLNKKDIFVEIHLMNINERINFK